jgi:hypothetical protein
LTIQARAVFVLVELGSHGLYSYSQAGGFSGPPLASIPSSDSPAAFTFDAAGNNIYVSYHSSAPGIEKFSSTGTDLGQFVMTPSGSGPIGLAFHSSNLLLALQLDSEIREYTSAGQPLPDFATPLLPGQVALNKAGDVFVGSITHSISEYSPTGAFITAISGVVFPQQMVFDSAGNLYVPDYGGGPFHNGSVAKITFDNSGNVSSVDDSFILNANLGGGIAVGPQDVLYVGLNFNGAIEKYSTSGQDLGFFGLSGDAPGVYLEFKPQPAAAAPEPASLTLMAIGAAWLAGWRKRRPKKGIRPAL